jgi:CobQ-like glutamine amidotransferase family enzyme
MITLTSFHPAHFNNNADQANIEVLTWMLNKANLGYEVSAIISPESDFVMIGDASFAALANYESKLESLIPMLAKRLQDGSPTLLVGSSYEFYLKRMPGLPEFRVSDRASKFVSVETSLNDAVIGYKNSELFGAEVFISGAFVGTQLYGPILAKNPDLLELILRGLGAEAVFEESDLGLIAEVRSRTIF